MRFRFIPSEMVMQNREGIVPTRLGLPLLNAFIEFYVRGFSYFG
jgi:hypothetical protein